MATSPNRSELGQLGASDVANTESSLHLWNGNALVGVQDVAINNDEGDEIVKRHHGSRERYTYHVNQGYSGSFTIAGGRLEDYMLLRNFIAGGYESTYYGFGLRSNGKAVGYLVTIQKTHDQSSELWRICVPGIVIGDLGSLPVSGAPGADKDIVIPFTSTAQAVGMSALVYPVLETFTMTATIWQPNTGTASNIILSEVAKKVYGGGGTGWVQDEGKGADTGDYLIEVNERVVGTTARPYGGTPITDIVTVTPATPAGQTTVTIPGAARANDTEIDVLYAALLADII